MRFFELFIAIILGTLLENSSASNVSASSNVSQNGCPPELNACLELVKAHQICTSFNKICTAIENGNASHQILSFEANRCNGSQVFCPLTRECLAPNSTCNVDTVASRFGRNVTPWGANCSAGQEFCSVSMSCLPVNTTCSLKALYDWQLNGNMTYGPYGQVCSTGQTFCLATLSCIASGNASCEVPFNASSGSPCENNEKLCGKTGGCIAMNSTCNKFPAVNMTNRPDPGRGWKQLCQVRQSVCTRSLAGLAHCFPKVSHCEGKNHTIPLPSPPTTSPNVTSPNVTSPNVTSPNATLPSCGANQIFCNETGRCMFSNETCCPRDHYECHLQGRCIPFHEPCPYESPSVPCQPSADPCKDTLSNSSILCGGRFTVCDALVNGNASTFSHAISAVNQMACHGNGTYCPLSGLCTPSGAPCTLDSAPSNNSSAPHNNSSNPNNRNPSSPWGMSCPGGKSFCGLTMQCEAVCSVRKIYEWITNGNMTYGPNGHVCNAGTKFCFATMSCISANASCKYNLMTPHGNAGNISVNGSSYRNHSHIDDLCKRHDDFCLDQLKCVPGGSQCNAFPNLNYTGVNDTGTGWMQACKISNPLCQRKKYGVDKCFPVLGKCLITRNVTKYRCFAPRFAYCELTKKCINASDHCCSPGETFCPDRNRCIRMGEKCKMDACKDTPCGKIFQHVDVCGSLNEICPLIVNAPGNLTKYFTRKNNGTIPHCKPGEKFCFFSNECQTEPCGINLDEDGMSAQSPWGELCPGGKSFCRFTMSCIPSSNNCTMRALQNWMNAGNTSVSPFGIACPAGKKFCLASYSCISNMDNCTIPIPLLALNATYNMSTADIFCGPHHDFCPKQFACVKKGDPCRDPPALNFTGASDNGTGFLPPCQLKKVFCPQTLYGGFKCGANRNFSQCLERKLKPCHEGFYLCDKSRKCIPNGSPCSQCPVGETFCVKTSRCIRSSDYCLAPGECPPYQTNCPILGGCINKTISCLPPQSKIVYKTVWYFEQLKTITPSLFPSGDTIAITSISNVSGSLIYHDGSSWVDVSGISPSSALVLGKTSRINFIPSDSTYHGVILLNYTVISGSVGAKINASSSARAVDDVIAIVLLAYHLPPVLGKKDVPCIVKEDSRANKISLEDQMNITIRNISHESNITDDVLPFLKRTTAQYYFNSLKFAKTSRYGVGAVNLENDPRRGKFSNAPPASRGSPVIKDISGSFNFVPTLNYHGPFNASFAGVNLVKYSIDYPIRALQFSPYVSSIINILLYDKNVSMNVINAYNSVLKDLDNKRSAPSKANVMSSIDALIAKGSNVEGLNTVKTLFTQTFQYAAAETSGAEMPPRRYDPVTVALPSGEFFVQYSDITINLGCKVIPINDAPILTSFITYFPPIPYNLSVTPYNGFTVSEITTRIPIPYGSTPPKFSKPKPFIEDVDGDVPGIAIVFAKNSSLGAYYYKTPGSSWQLVDLNNTLINGKPSGRGEVLLLKPKSSLKFQMHDPDALWSNTEGRKLANVLLAAWDQSDNQTDGVHNFFFPTDNNASISIKYASAFTARFGCDNKPGSRGRIDVCGRCGGDGLWCRGCDGVIFSGARIDHCGNCTGGNTSKEFNFRKDCGGGCGTSFKDDCGVCQKYGKVRNFTDCSGTCFGGAIINKCGNCVLGNTGKTANFGEDLCGVCGGSNTTCLDCAQVPRGKKQIDICGNCLDPSDSRYNGECIRLGNMSPISGRHNSPTKVTVVGAGLQRYSTAICQFVNDSGVVQNLARADIRDKQFVISTVNINVGTYRLRCQLDALNVDYFTLNNFTFYNSSAISYSSITPNETEANSGSVNVTISGSGFPDTGYIKCVSNKKFSSPAVYVDSTTVKCLFPNAPKSADLKVAVSFGEGDINVPSSAPGFHFFTNSPYPTAVSFSQNLQALVVTMNKPSQHKGRSCSGVFSAASISSFGSRAKCRLRTPLTMFISLLGRPTVGPGDSVIFNNGSLTAKFEEVTKRASGTKSLVVQGPPKAIVPKARLSGPNKAGTCAKIRLDASASFGAGGRQMNFTWSVAWAADQDSGALTPNVTADLSSIQATLAGLPAFSPRLVLGRYNLVLGFKYEFTVKVTNFLGEVSENASLVVERENKQLPLLAAGQASRKVRASRGVTILARAILSPCLDPNSVANNVLFNWEIDAVGIDLKVTDRPRLKIKKGTLQGGRRYTLTVTASMASDQTLSTTKNIVLDVQSGPLVAKIRGGSYRVVGATSTLTLDGRKSFDPDGSSDSEWYNWECADSSGDPCFVPDPANAGRKIRLVLASTAKITVDVGPNLEANSRYTFTMTYNKGSRKASKSVTIKVEPGSPPDVEIRPQANSKENPTSIVIIKAIAKSTMQTNNVSWECVEEDGFGYIDLTTSGVALTPLSFTFKKKSGKSRVSKNFALVIAANTLANGVNYKFRVTVTHADSSAAGETIITTNAAPSQGILDISPSNGTAMETTYKLSASEGWSDDPDDLPLKYQFGYFKKGSSGKEKLLGLFGESNEVEGIKFPPGDESNSNSLTVFVDCKDALGAVTRQTATITVMPKVITTAFLGEAKNDILKSFESADWNSALGSMGALLTALPSGSSDPNQTSAVTEMKEAFAGSTLSILQNGGVADDPAAKSVMYESMGSITSGGSAMSDSIKSNIKDTILGIETGASSSKRRRRREVAGSSSVEVYTVSQAETTISLVSNLIDPNLYDSSTIAMKASVLSLAESSGIKVCAGLALGMPAAVVKDKLLVLRSEKDSLASADTVFVDMACNDCPSSLQKSAKIKLGISLQTTYSSWSCAAETICSGVCLITSQQINDLLSSAPNNKTLTNIVDFKIYNPETYAAISISTLKNPVTYQLPVLENATLSNETYFQCKRWDSGSSSWTASGCVTNPTAVDGDNGTKYIECSCTEVSYLAAFQVDSLPTTPAPTTTPAPVTTLAQTAAPTDPPITVRRARFALVGDYDTLVTPAKEAQFKADVRKSIATVMKVKESSIVNITLSKGSIIVIFAYIPSSSDTGASMDADISNLQAAVKNSNFSVTLSDGTVLKADPVSFSWTSDNSKPTVPAPQAATTKLGLTETEIIIIAVVCGLLGVIILVIIVVVCHRKKNKESKISSESSRAQLRGDDVEMANRRKVDGNDNQAVET